MEQYKVEQSNAHQFCPIILETNRILTSRNYVFLEILVLDFLSNKEKVDQHTMEMHLNAILKCSSDTYIEKTSAFLSPIFLTQILSLLTSNYKISLYAIAIITQSINYSSFAINHPIPPEIFLSLLNSFDESDTELIPSEIICEYIHRFSFLNKNISSQYTQVLFQLFQRITPSSMFLFCKTISNFLPFIDSSQFPVIFPPNSLQIASEMIIPIKKGLELNISFFKENLITNWFQDISSLLYKPVSCLLHFPYILNITLSTISNIIHYVTPTEANSLFNQIAPRLPFLFCPIFLFKSVTDTLIEFIAVCPSERLFDIAFSILFKQFYENPSDDLVEANLNIKMLVCLIDLALKCYDESGLKVNMNLKENYRRIKCICVILEKGAEMSIDNCASKLLSIAKNLDKNEHKDLLNELSEWASEIFDTKDDDPNSVFLEQLAHFQINK